MDTCPAWSTSLSDSWSCLVQSRVSAACSAFERAITLLRSVALLLETSTDADSSIDGSRSASAGTAAKHSESCLLARFLVTRVAALRHLSRFCAAALDLGHSAAIASPKSAGPAGAGTSASTSTGSGAGAGAGSIRPAEPSAGGCDDSRVSHSAAGQCERALIGLEQVAADQVCPSVRPCVSSWSVLGSCAADSQPGRGTKLCAGVGVVLCTLEFLTAASGSANRFCGAWPGNANCSLW